MPQRKYIERRLYFYKCTICGVENRQTFKRAKTYEGVCRKCRREAQAEGQESLFDTPPKADDILV